MATAGDRVGGASGFPPMTLGTQLSYGIGAGANGIKNGAFATYLMF